MDRNPIFHLAIPINDLARAKTFYCDGLGCQVGRESQQALILNFYGHQVVAHLTDETLTPPKSIYPRARVKRQGIAMEIDILAVDDTALVLVECKSRLSKDDVDEFLEKLTRFKIAFPHYKNYQAYGAVAGIEINEGVDRYAYKKGLFVIKPSGDTVTIANDADFQPVTW